MKKHLSFILAAALTMASFPAVTASAADDDKKDFVVIGDSIAAGEIRDGFVEHNYGEILADYYGGTVANYATSGMDSDVLLKSVKELSDEQKNAVKEAECVVISIGGNDIIHYFSKSMLTYFAEPNPANDFKNFLKAGYTEADIPEEPTIDDLMNMVDADSVANFSKNMVNALELLGEIRGTASKLRNSSNGYIKTHIIKNLTDTIAEIKSINPDAEIVVQNIYQPVQLTPDYLAKTYGSGSKYIDIVGQVRDVAEGLTSSFDEQLAAVAADTGVKKADIRTDFTSMEDGVTQSDANPGHAAYFVDIATGSLSTGDVHPNQKGHLAIASKIITTLGDTHNDGGLLSDIYENLSDKASYPAAALKTYEAAAGTYMMGDVTFDGIIDGRDATMVLTDYAATSTGKATKFRYRQNITAEVNGDSIIDGRDATTILTYYAKASAGTEKGSFDDYIKNNK